MKPLFDLTQVPPRPTITQEMIHQAATILAKQLEPDSDEYTIDRTRMIKSLCEQYEPHIDGYELAKKLEDNCRWDISVSDVEWLDTMDGEVNDLLMVDVKKWVTENTITPPYPVGTRVKILRTKEFGVVTESDERAIQRGVYLLRMDSQSEFENSRRIVKYEDVTYVD